ncbi:hypothetical protein BH708_12035 [Brachybacterium sp. P6-10-X1]|uniref:hypothetical protein n=1 Tax=Brachybacterium sp. P6-10-X1 TaxID=1903186 RepID=UPI000971B5BD|nr:hypothetical protein [Brachybacterium sp. P6-10-X1]APX33319.1 hypothetical protein BH708_12035 [Brachybacterium sp. P6-10-X1]
MRRPLEKHAGALLSSRQWAELGFHTRDLASDHFTTVFPGYRTPTDHPASVNTMARILQNRVQVGCVLSHTTAALFWGVPFPLTLDAGISALSGSRPWASDGTLRIPSLEPGRSLRAGAKLPVLRCRVERAGTSGVGRGAIVHRLRPGRTARLDALTVSAVPEVLRELATMMPLWDLVASVEAIIGPNFRYPGQTISSMIDEVEESRGHHGIPRLLDALQRAQPSVRSPGETIMRLLLEATGFPPAVPNLPVHHPTTGQRREIDLAWERAQVGLEYDGEGHRLTKQQWRLDEVRRDELASYGWSLARANGADLRHPLRILLRLRRTLGQRGVHVPSEQHIRRTVDTVRRTRLSLRIAPLGA